jgi:hypothetical protein
LLPLLLLSFVSADALTHTRTRTGLRVVSAVIDFPARQGFVVVRPVGGGVDSSDNDNNFNNNDDLPTAAVAAPAAADADAALPPTAEVVKRAAALLVDEVSFVSWCWRVRECLYDWLNDWLND